MLTHEKINGNKLSATPKLPNITIITLIIITVFCAAVSAYSPVSIFGVIFLSAASASCAVLCLIKGRYFLVVCALPAVILAYVFWGQISISAAGFLFIFCAFPLFIAKKRSLRRNETIAVTAVFTGIGLIIYYTLVLLVENNGIITAETFVNYYNAFNEQYSKMFAEYGYDEQTVQKILQYAVFFIPAFVICLLEIIAYFTTVIFAFIGRIFRIQKYIMPQFFWRLGMSSISAYIFCICYFLSVLFSSDNGISFISLAAENLIIILTPGFSVIGIKKTINRIKNRNGKAWPIIVGASAILLLFLNILAFLIAVSFIGVIETIMDEINAYKKRSE